MKYLVLGSAGQVCEPLCRYLKEQGHQVMELDIVNDSFRQDLRHIDSITKTIYFEWADFIVFAAFFVGGSKFLSKLENTNEFLNHNIDLMREVFRILEDIKKPFIFTSSQMSNMSHSPYGTLKRLGEFYTKNLGGLNVKFWNVFGYEGNDPNKHHVITDFINMAKKGTIKSMTTGNEERQFLHTDDSSKALYTLSQKYNELDKNEEYAITSFQWHTIKEVAECIVDLIPDTKLEFSKAVDNVQAGYRNTPSEHILKYWQPEISLKNGIIKVIKEMEKE